MERDKVECRCSFCGKSRDRVERVVGGPGGVFICNECVALCAEILAEERGGEVRPGRPREALPSTQQALATLAAELHELRASIEALRADVAALRQQGGQGAR